MLLPFSLLVVCITSSEQQSFTMFQKCYSLLFIILKQQQAKKIYSLDILFVNENTDLYMKDDNGFNCIVHNE